jgi:hypothetical protein
MLDAASLLVQHGFCLSLHGMRIAQPFDQSFDADVISRLCALHVFSPTGLDSHQGVIALLLCVRDGKPEEFRGPDWLHLP